MLPVVARGGVVRVAVALVPDPEREAHGADDTRRPLHPRTLKRVASLTASARLAGSMAAPTTAPRVSRLTLLGLMPSVSRWLTAGVAVSVVLTGLLLPAFTLASGAVAGSVP